VWRAYTVQGTQTDKHLPPSTCTGQFFQKIRHSGFGVFIDIWSPMVSTVQKPETLQTGSQDDQSYAPLRCFFKSTFLFQNGVRSRAGGLRHVSGGAAPAPRAAQRAQLCPLHRNGAGDGLHLFGRTSSTRRHVTQNRTPYVRLIIIYLNKPMLFSSNQKVDNVVKARATDQGFLRLKKELFMTS